MPKHSIDLTPTWSALLPAMLAVLANPDANPLSKKVINEELTRMAKLADHLVTIQKKEKLVKEETITYTLPRHQPTPPTTEHE